MTVEAVLEICSLLISSLTSALLIFTHQDIRIIVFMLFLVVKIHQTKILKLKFRKIDYLNF